MLKIDHFCFFGYFGSFWPGLSTNIVNIIFGSKKAPVLVNNDVFAKFLKGFTAKNSFPEILSVLGASRKKFFFFCVDRYMSGTNVYSGMS